MKKWSKKEEKDILNKIKNNEDIEKIAKNMQRTVSSVKSRL